MSTLLKDIYSPVFYEKFSAIASEALPSFDRQKFISLLFDENWKKRELKDRMKHTSAVLNQFLPKDFEKAVPVLEKIITLIRQKDFKETSLVFMFFPDYIETYGIDHYETSVKHIEFVTQFTSCEFAVRPFILKYGEKMLQQMHHWSLHENHHVRRLASEGSRPRLPWAMAIPELKKNPGPLLPLLENLKNDPSEYVRRSVANHLNDISKDHPGVMLAIAEKWKGNGKETDAIIKHGSRTLLKQGNPEILHYYGLTDSLTIGIEGFKILTPTVQIGDALSFSFTLQNNEEIPKPVRIEYGIYYLRQNGQLSKKVFKISERQIRPGEQLKIEKKQSFKIITTRKFYKGPQQLSIIINGTERGIMAFELA
ncbi:DNA alkylation repair protein [Flavobacterium humi]|uniref:DNA alkylation repair protein n=1 Tax=Flavobacterium humi TaxID=2562683 RepID=A0A4Z0L9X6_9FLAO|nr:DNA alkylation repair protein [Flavobacterium humi]TGD57999.1 DNA alkylation repair protein [Flavobacterium humi]